MFSPLSPFFSDGTAHQQTGISLPNSQRQHRTSHAPKDVLPLRKCVNYCAPCQPLVRDFSGWIRSPPPAALITLGRPNETETEQGVGINTGLQWYLAQKNYPPLRITTGTLAYGYYGVLRVGGSLMSKVPL